MATLRKAMVRLRKDHSRTAGEARDALQNPDDLNRLAVARWLLNDMGDKYHSGRTHAYSLKTLIDGNMFQSDRPSWLYQQYVGSLDAFAPRLRSSHDRLQAFYNTLSRIDRYDPRFNPHVHNERQLERVRPPPGIVEMLDHDAENGLWSTRPGHASFPRG
ncbi:uncharacterized protein PFL1_01474 [Pseudozyma flocculosa PF-1]|uniref:Uncharacterized protein n=1 Tax=Pseudozyma flocculosa TaxID=84751 RepID=A0A5C3FBV8_9BASI|nr:uncharacterized protein PFL1_01474 [Pseudozyma flocculosa PF-1]EPQ31289.1 hypothetical protein PFL1_01474 [Pseudozyma flocculosa PF-1]SPO41750.1 uncharacterized protein PSFLO_07232 [Pseudozyma flocculosa]